MPGWLVATVLSVFALVATALFIMQVRTVWRHARQTKVKVEAEVIALVEREDSEDLTAPTTYAPVYRFTARDGQSYEVVDHVSSRPARYQTGQKASLVYPEGRPDEAQPPRQAARLLGVILTGILMIIFIPVALFGWAMVLL